MKRNIVLSLAVGVATLFASCSDYLDINDNPNRAPIEKIPPTLQLSASQTLAYRMITGDTRNIENGINTGGLTRVGNLMMNSWAGNVNSVTNPFSDEFRGNITSSFYSGIWDWGYVSIGNFQNIIDYNSDEFDNHKAIAMMLKSFYMQYIVDLYGDVPYSEAFKGSELLYPTYDDDRQIYRDLVTQIDDALALIEAADGNDAAVGSEDEMFNGNMQQWVRFGNTVKLKLLIRQSDLTDAETVSYINGQLATLAGAEYLTTDATINPGYNSTNGARQNPFYAVYGFGITGVASSSRNLITASEHAADALNNTSDPRRSRIFTIPTGSGGNVVGIEQGNDADEAPNNPSFIGPAFVPTDIEAGSSMDGYVMTLAEVKFLLSEAALRYPASFPGMDPETLWEEGIQASFDRVQAGDASSYIASIATVPSFGWDATPDKVEAIMTQKWIALMNGNAAESWIDYVRTGYPFTPDPDADVNNGIGRPKRLMYPVSEYVGNSANIPTQTAADVFATGPFWAQ